MNDPQLVTPSEHWLASYLDALDEYRVHHTELGALRSPADCPPGTTIFQVFEDHRMGRNLPDGYVQGSTFWLVDGEEYVGTGGIRHRLTPGLERFGGHIGYAIRPSRWNQGYGTIQLRFLLAEAARLGLDRVLLTCNETNVASARVMEKCGGVYQDTIDHVVDDVPRRVRRYWIATGD